MSWITATPLRVLTLVWFAFVARGLFYCVQEPIWEGYDEWAHFAYVQHLVENGRLPARGDKISKEIRASLSLVPLPYGLRDLNVRHISHEDFWRLSREERITRKQRLDAIPVDVSREADDSVALYEAQQPPLYYVLLALPYQALRHSSLPSAVFADIQHAGRVACHSARVRYITPPARTACSFDGPNSDRADAGLPDRCLPHRK